MTAWYGYWTVGPAGLLICLAAPLLYVWWNEPRGASAGYCAAACCLLALCFFSPLALLSEHYLFSAHMAVHVLLLLCAGPLLVPGLLSGERFTPFFLFLRRVPWIAWLAGMAVMWVWHVPVVFNAVMAGGHGGGFRAVSLAEPLSLLLAGVLFSAPVVHPDARCRLQAPAGVVYLFTACTACSLLGLLITFAPVGTYHHFLSMHDARGLNGMITRQWGITQETDQQAAGLIMWVPCCLIYVTRSLLLLLTWLREERPSFHYSKNSEP